MWNKWIYIFRNFLTNNKRPISLLLLYRRKKTEVIFKCVTTWILQNIYVYINICTNTKHDKPIFLYFLMYRIIIHVYFIITHKRPLHTAFISHKLIFNAKIFWIKKKLKLLLYHKDQKFTLYTVAVPYICIFIVHIIHLISKVEYKSEFWHFYKK